MRNLNYNKDSCFVSSQFFNNIASCYAIESFLKLCQLFL